MRCCLLPCCCLPLASLLPASYPAGASSYLAAAKGHFTVRRAPQGHKGHPTPASRCCLSPALLLHAAALLPSASASYYSGRVRGQVYLRTFRFLNLRPRAEFFLSFFLPPTTLLPIPLLAAAYLSPCCCLPPHPTTLLPTSHTVVAHHSPRCCLPLPLTSLLPASASYLAVAYLSPCCRLPLASLLPASAPYHVVACLQPHYCLPVLPHFLHATAALEAAAAACVHATLWRRRLPQDAAASVDGKGEEREAKRAAEQIWGWCVRCLAVLMCVATAASVDGASVDGEGFWRERERAIGADVSEQQVRCSCWQCC